MQFFHSFSALLVSVFFAVSGPSLVDAIPTGRASQGFVRDSDLFSLGSKTHNLTARAPTPIRLSLKPFLILNWEKGYTASISIGTNSKSFNVLVDSGTTELWIISEDASDLNGRNSIGPKSSTTFKDTKETFASSYEDKSSMKGIIATDNVKVGGTTLANFKFGVAKILSGNLVTEPYDGIMGFGKSSHSKVQGPTILEALADAGAIPAAVAGFKISRHTDGDTGEILLGDVNEQLFDREKASTMKNVKSEENDDGLFRVTISSVEVDNAALQIPSRVGSVDVGTSVIFVPPADFTAIKAQFPGAVDMEELAFALPCNNQKALALTIGGKKWSIEASDLVAIPAPDAGDNMCYSAIAGDEDLTEWVIGTPFLKNVYLSLDVTKDQVMIAPLVGPT